jgi:hypothetical protein
MSRDQTQELINALTDAGFTPESYSGRGMYGKNCVSVKNESIFDVGRALAELDSIPEPSQDQLGKGIVLYWPSCEWPS